MPADISYLQSLEKLLLSGNPLEYLPGDIEELHELNYLELPANTMEKAEKKNVKKYLPDTDIVYIEGDDN